MALWGFCFFVFSFFSEVSSSFFLFFSFFSSTNFSLFSLSLSHPCVLPLAVVLLILNMTTANGVMPHCHRG